MAKKADKKILRANFMYGYANKGKYDIAASTINRYLNSINDFIELMKYDTTCYPAIFLLDTKSPVITELEKQNRDALLGSAYSQKASHVALDKLHGQFLFIKKKMCGELREFSKEIKEFAKCTSLLIGCLTNEDSRDTIKTAIDREYQSIYRTYEKDRAKYRAKHNLSEDDEVNIDFPSKTEKLEYYQQLKVMIDSLSDENLRHIESEIRFQFFDRLDSYKTPKVTFSPLQLDSRTCKLTKLDDNNHFDYMLEMTVAKDSGISGRLAIPFKTSSKCKKRLHSFKNCQPTICVDKFGRLKLSVPVELPKATARKGKDKVVIGIDLGIRKIFSLSNGKFFGTFSELCGKHTKLVEEKLGHRSTLRSTMRAHQKELRKKSTSEKRKAELRIKISNIAKSLNRNKRLTKCRNRYNHATCVTMSKAIKELVAYLSSIESKVLVVLEDLDIKEHNSSKASNKATSMWSRGQIVDRLIQKIQLLGIEHGFVDPAYTSQMCPHCFNIDKSNRNGEQFKCTSCGHEADADTNAGVNIKYRYFDEEINSIVEEFDFNTHLKHKKIKDVLDKRHQLRIA